MTPRMVDHKETTEQEKPEKSVRLIGPTLPQHRARDEKSAKPKEARSARECLAPLHFEFE